MCAVFNPEAKIKGFTNLFHSALMRNNIPCLTSMLNLKDDHNACFVAKLGLMLLRNLLKKNPKASLDDIKQLFKLITDKLPQMKHRCKAINKIFSNEGCDDVVRCRLF